MSIDENIKYIADQKNLLDSILKIEEEKQQRARLEVGHLTEKIGKLMTEHSEIQKSLSGTVPAELMAQARKIAQLEHELKILVGLKELTQNEFKKLEELHDAYHAKNADYSTLKSDLSKSDASLLRKFSTTFKTYLKDLGFSSFETNSLFIDQHTFMPRVMIGEADTRKKVRVDFGSSASDWVRIITAFTLSLHACRTNSPRSNHPNVSIFDEPAQQNIDPEDHLKFFDIIADVAKNGGQVIIAATDKDHSVRTKAKSLNMKIFDFGDEYVLSPVPQQ
jgi:hypothetical protein